ncbi:unnamed protein product [Didymodactylos carnosus]|uniref:Uncharacterized protein n=1 Tax=Didymodactylos carnosus TaxID=1234261 RepID=A0A814RB94_9BILA|nr:unnamed protein product [Didymodactylos carnosus]CAF1131156.1 unnamed protein product [Didymodactylos carnosus]CAF3748469.1 unnamed protein product [Didymodactylos carnosus]CAF3894860.1 unnamed protein product [Didymodactylos carnosus]
MYLPIISSKLTCNHETDIYNKVNELNLYYSNGITILNITDTIEKFSNISLLNIHVDNSESLSSNNCHFISIPLYTLSLSLKYLYIDQRFVNPKLLHSVFSIAPNIQYLEIDYDQLIKITHHFYDHILCSYLKKIIKLSIKMNSLSEIKFEKLCRTFSNIQQLQFNLEYNLQYVINYIPIIIQMILNNMEHIKLIKIQFYDYFTDYSNDTIE